MPNTKGGKKHKRNKNQNIVSKNLRLKEEGQEYAQIKKCKGNITIFQSFPRIKCFIIHL